MKERLIDFLIESFEKNFSEDEIKALMENESDFREYTRELIKVFEKARKIKSFSSAEKTVSNKLNLVKSFMEIEKQPEFVFEAAVPHYSTGINVLEDVIKKIVPTLEADYKKLTTNEEQRESFKNHILNAVINSLKSPRMYQSEKPETGADNIIDRQKKLEDENSNFEQLEKEKNNLFSNDADESGKIIKITKSGKDTDQDFQMFLLADQDRTGANLAYISFKKVGKQIKDAYEMLDNAVDKETFYDYLLTNLKLYFSRFEEELRMDLPGEKMSELENIEGDEGFKQGEEKSVSALDNIDFIS